jgi:hypothetical protein
MQDHVEWLAYLGNGEACNREAGQQVVEERFPGVSGEPVHDWKRSFESRESLLEPGITTLEPAITSGNIVKESLPHYAPYLVQEAFLWWNRHGVNQITRPRCSHDPQILTPNYSHGSPSPLQGSTWVCWWATVSSLRCSTSYSIIWDHALMEHLVHMNHTYFRPMMMITFH